jgi:hypothetical protein
VGVDCSGANLISPTPVRPFTGFLLRPRGSDEIDVYQLPLFFLVSYKRGSAGT